MSLPQPSSDDSRTAESVAVPPLSQSKQLDSTQSSQPLPESVPSLERLLSEAVADYPAPATTADESPLSARLPELGRSRVWGVPFDHVTLSEARQRIGEMIRFAQPGYVITANLNYVMLHADRPEMQKVTEDADLILADGQPIVWRSRLSKQALPERVAGSELIYELADLSSQNGWGIYFLGGKPGVAATCAERLSEQYPGLVVAGVESPPFRPLSAEEQQQQDERIQCSGAKILLVAFGQPKGEQWIHQHYQRLGIPVSIQLGASFDFVAGTAKRAPAVWQRLGLEWAYRMLSDPRRLVPRYACNAAFLMRALIEDWKRVVTGWGMGEWTGDARGEHTLDRRRG
ncbi:MAG: WecB/TagA/CpsF family glycosyltransferase [Rubripirellula sp.]